LCFERIVYLELEDLAAVERRIEAGDMDINNAFDGARTAELKEKFPGWVRTTPALITTYWSFNGAQEPFNDPRVRQALSMALDREFLTEKVLTPGYVPAYSLVPPGIANYDAERPEVAWKSLTREERLVEARRLLEDAGFGPDTPLRFEFIHRSTDDNTKPPPVAQSNWKDIADWVDPVIVKQDTKVLYARLRQKDFEVADGAWVADYDDPYNFLYLLDSNTGQQNYGDFSNPAYDALLAASSAELDLKKRATLLAEAEQIMLNENAVAPMWYQVTKALVDPTLTGWVDNPQEKNRSRYFCREGLD
ncbi:MAG: ABC transporter substrate-binding protein, partial [Pseudomonadota bacterium]